MEDNGEHNSGAPIILGIKDDGVPGIRPHLHPRAGTKAKWQRKKGPQCHLRRLPCGTRMESNEFMSEVTGMPGKQFQMPIS